MFYASVLASLHSADTGVYCITPTTHTFGLTGCLQEAVPHQEASRAGDRVAR